MTVEDNQGFCPKTKETFFFMARVAFDGLAKLYESDPRIREILTSVANQQVPYALYLLKVVRNGDLPKSSLLKFRMVEQIVYSSICPHV